MSKPPFYAFVTGIADIAALQEFATLRQWPTSNVREGDALTAAAFLKNNPSPEFLVVDIASEESTPMMLEELATACDPDTKVVTCGTVNQYSFYCWLTDIGISSYLLKPITVKALEDAWQKAFAVNIPAGGEAKPQAHIIGVIGTRGGVGATTMAVYLAAMQSDLGRKTALVELDPQDGSAALMLDLEPSRGYREAVERPDRIDNLFVERAMNRLRPNLHVLSAEESIHERVHYHERAADMLLKELRDTYQVVVLDIPRTTLPFYRSCLTACDQVVAVSDLTLTGLRDGIRLTEMFKTHLRRNPPIFVANRVGLSTRHEITPADYARGIQGKLEHSVPFAPELFMTTSGELKGLKLHAAPAIKALEKLNAQLFPVLNMDTAAKDKPAKKPGLFKKKG